MTYNNLRSASLLTSHLINLFASVKSPDTGTQHTSAQLRLILIEEWGDEGIIILKSILFLVLLLKIFIVFCLVAFVNDALT